MESAFSAEAAFEGCGGGGLGADPKNRSAGFWKGRGRNGPLEKKKKKEPRIFKYQIVLQVEPTSMRQELRDWPRSQRSGQMSGQPQIGSSSCVQRNLESFS